jgi:hypothetical protein
MVFAWCNDYRSFTLLGQGCIPIKKTLLSSSYPVSSVAKRIESGYHPFLIALYFGGTMKKLIYCILLISIVMAVAACAPTPTPTPTLDNTAIPAPIDTLEPTETSAPTDTPTPEPSPTPDYPPEGYGPSNFPENINPLTGLKVENPAILNRRPILTKVENLPRTDRPQYGLSLADIVYEYYTELGSTRFGALFYGQDASQVMPIRSARFIDINLVRMYKSVFVFGSAYDVLYRKLVNSEFSSQLILENPAACPAVCRFEPKDRNYLYTDTAALQEYLVKRGVDNSRQNLDGMTFKMDSPEGGDAADQVYVRYSGAVYNRWDYDEASGKYLRFSDSADDINNNNPQYEQLTDALTEQPIAVDTLVVMQVRHNEIDPRPEVEVVDVSMLGTGNAYIARDGKIFKAKWMRMDEDQVLTLVNEDGTPFPFKPGQTWIEVVSLNSVVKPEGSNWRFTFVSDW